MERGWYLYLSTDGETWPAVSAPSHTVADVNTMQPEAQRGLGELENALR